MSRDFKKYKLLYVCWINLVTRNFRSSRYHLAVSLTEVFYWTKCTTLGQDSVQKLSEVDKEIIYLFRSHTKTAIKLQIVSLRNGLIYNSLKVTYQKLTVVKIRIIFFRIFYRSILLPPLRCEYYFYQINLWFHFRHGQSFQASYHPSKPRIREESVKNWKQLEHPSILKSCSCHTNCFIGNTTKNCLCLPPVITMWKSCMSQTGSIWITTSSFLCKIHHVKYGKTGSFPSRYRTLLVTFTGQRLKSKGNNNN